VNDEPRNQDDEQLDAEQAKAEEAAAEDQAPAEDAAAPSEEAEAPQPQAEADTPQPEAGQEQAEAPAAEGGEETAPADRGAAQGGKKKDEVVPGAELDPIAIEPEVELDAEERARLEAEAEERARREAELEQVDQPVAAEPAKLHADSRYTATGKRKSSVARVILSAGEGTIQVNERRLEEYFPRLHLQAVAKQPLVQTGYEESVDVRVRVHGGGIAGQAAAVRHGIARALCDVDPQLRRELKRRGMLTRDARIKERRKAGLKKARKRPQFSKR
jgi:small subunit ribosomal protein S9